MGRLPVIDGMNSGKMLAYFGGRRKGETGP